MSDPFNSEEWNQFVDVVRREALEKLTGSDAMVSIAPGRDGVDIKFAVELGLAIMLDKPILVLQMPGREIPEHLRRVADEIVCADIDTFEGRVSAGEKIKAFMEGVTDGKDLSEPEQA